MNIFRKWLLTLYTCLSLSIIPLYCANALSPEEKMWFDQINAMNEEEQLVLWNTIVEEVQKEANKLPEGEREKFLESFWTEVSNEAVKLEEKLQNAQEEPVQQPELPIEAPIVKTPEKPVKVTSSKADQASQLIDSLIRSLENVLRKASIIPDINGKLQDWAKKGAVSGLPQSASWNGLRADMEKLIAKMKTLKDKDIKTNAYKYLDALSKNENLYNNLSQLNAVLSSFESKIEAPEFGAQTLSESSKNATQKVLNSIIEGLYRLRLPAMIDELIATYDVRAQELKGEQDKAIKAAQTAPVRTRETRAMVSGTAATQATYTKGREQESYFDAFYGPGGQPSPRRSSGSDFGGGFDRGGGDTGGKSEAGSKPSSGGGAGGSSSSGSKPESKGETKKDEGKKADGDKKGDKDKDKDKKKEEDKLVRGHLDKLTLQLDELHGLFDERPLNTIEAYMIGTAPFNKQLAKTVLPNALEKTKAATASARNIARAFRSRLKNADQQKDFRSEINEIAKEHANVLSMMANQIKNLKSREMSINADKKYGFLGGLTVPDTATLTTEIPAPVSLYDLQERLNELVEALQDIR